MHLGDVARQGSDEFGYRLRLSAPQPDFELRVVPSSLTLLGRWANALTVYALRKNGIDGSIRLDLDHPPTGFTTTPVTLSGPQNAARLVIRTDLARRPEPVNLSTTSSIGKRRRRSRRRHSAADKPTGIGVRTPAAPLP